MQRPGGFTLISVVLAFVLVAKVVALAAEPPVRVGHGPVKAGLNLLVLALMAVTVEALWRVRPWCTRAFAFMMAAALLSLEADLAASHADVVGHVIGLGYAAALLGMGLAYVHRRARKRFGPAPLRRGTRVPLRGVVPPRAP